MPKSIHSPEYRQLCEHLKAMREEQGVTQRELAERLSVVPSWVANVELGERRIDFVELIWVCKALEVDPAKTLSKLAKEIA